jgi:hypothetical protein
MRSVWYGLGWSLLVGAGALLSLLPAWTTKVGWFFLFAACIGAILTGAWLLVGATADERPRPRAGYVLMVIGALGVPFYMWQGHLVGVLWTCLLMVGGLVWRFRSVALDRKRAKKPANNRVRGPLWRRGQL